MTRSGLGVRPELFGPIEQHRPDFGFLEAHSENYFGESIARAKLLALRADYPISLHGVGLSLGRADDLDRQHLADLKHLVDEVEPLFVSEHLAWSAYSHRHVPDLLPLPLTSQALEIVCQHIDEMQTALGRQVLVENPSNYLLFEQLQIPEPEFLNALAVRTGCGLLMDVNNIHVSAANVGRDGHAYIDAINSSAIGQYHLAGYTEVERDKGGVLERVLIDTHNQTVYQPVWELFEHALNIHGRRPTLFEWDSDFPEFEVLLGECDKANQLMAKYPALQSTATSDDTTSVNSDISITHAHHLAQAQEHFLNGIMSLESQLTTAQATHQHRLWIYQNNVFGAVLDYLEEVYPATKGVVGESFFKQMVHQFLQEQAPLQGNIHLYGELFPVLCEQIDGLSGLVYLADLMRYEWALHSAYFAKVSDSLDPSEVQQDVLLTSAVAFNDSVSLLSSAYPIFEIQRQSVPGYEGEVAIDLNQSQDNILVYKLGYEVQTLVLEKEQMELLDEIKKSGNLLQAIEALQGSIEPDALSTALSLVFESCLLKFGNN